MDPIKSSKTEDQTSHSVLSDKGSVPHGATQATNGHGIQENTSKEH